MSDSKPDTEGGRQGGVSDFKSDTEGERQGEVSDFKSDTPRGERLRSFGGSRVGHVLDPGEVRSPGVRYAMERE